MPSSQGDEDFTSERLMIGLISSYIFSGYLQIFGLINGIFSIVHLIILKLRAYLCLLPLPIFSISERNVIH